MKAKKIVTMLLTLALLSASCVALGAGYTAGTYEATARGFGGDVKAVVTVDADKITDVALTGDQETPSIGGAALETLKEQILTAQGTEIDGVAGATVTTKAVKEAMKACIAAASGVKLTTSYKAGTYEAWAPGFGGRINAVVTVDETSIVDVVITGAGETPDIGAAALEIVKAQILEAQSTGVDGFTGATVSSAAARSAVAACIEQAIAE